MKVARYSLDGQPQGEVEIQDHLLILDERGTQAVHDTVVAYLAHRRQGNAKTKTRGEVSGGGKKPWRQKGTGRARAGSIRSPIWRHGGVVFGPIPRDYDVKVPAKVKALAFRKAFSERVAAGEVLLVDDLKVPTGKTRDFVGIMRKLPVSGDTLLVSAEVDENLARATRNVDWVEVTRPDFLNVYQLLRPDRIVFTTAAFERVLQRLAASSGKRT